MSIKSFVLWFNLISFWFNTLSSILPCWLQFSNEIGQKVNLSNVKIDEHNFSEILRMFMLERDDKPSEVTKYNLVSLYTKNIWQQKYFRIMLVVFVTVSLSCKAKTRVMLLISRGQQLLLIDRLIQRVWFQLINMMNKCKWAKYTCLTGWFRW